MEKLKANLTQGDFWRFLLISGFLSSIFNIFIRRSVAIERLPIGYYFLGGLASFVCGGLLYFFIRNWPGRKKTWVVWVTGFFWIVVALWGGRS